MVLAGRRHPGMPAHWCMKQATLRKPGAGVLQAEAERRLIISALADQRNQRFVLVRQATLCGPLPPRPVHAISTCALYVY